MKDGDVAIREAKAEDAEAIVRLWREFMAFHAGLDAALEMSEEAEVRWREWLLGKMADENALVTIVEAGGRPAGYSITKTASRSPVFKRREYGEIMEFMVTQRLRGGGIGRRLFEYQKDWLKRRGIDWLQIEVASKNETANGFWAKLGFEPVTERRVLDI